MNTKKQYRVAAAALAVLVLAALLLFAGGSWLEKRSRKPETRTELPQAEQEIVELVLNTYRVLLTRAKSSVHIWFRDQNTKEHVRKVMGF